MTASFTITPIPAFSDNYIWCIEKPSSSWAILVDPGDAQVCINYLAQQQKQLAAILLTHHHADHSAGIEQLCAYFPKVEVFGGAQSKISTLTTKVDEHDTVFVPALNFSAQVVSLPGHTLDHIAFVHQQALFCGDTLFHCGCGRLFEGSAKQMLSSLTKLANLSEKLAVYCTHEYTLANMKFALTIEPHNTDLQLAYKNAQVTRNQNQPTLPTSIAEQKAINPFLRCDNKQIQQQVQLVSKQPCSNILSTFTLLRRLKDQA